MTSEKFCLRWNDFERNISSAFKDIREEKEFFDVTIACEDEQLQAHKVILSACSPFFRNVLRRNQPPSQQGMLVLYLKGVNFRDMESVLNFMYHGEVNVAQDDLNSFLAVAEELRVKGLTQSTSGSSTAPTNSSSLPHKSPAPTQPPRRRPSEETHSTHPSSIPSKRPRPSSHLPPPRAPPAPPEDDDEIQEYLPVKSEPISQPTQPQEMYDQEQSVVAGGGMMMATEGEQYEENYGDYEEGYDEGAQYYQEASGPDAAAAGGQIYCHACDKNISAKNYGRHRNDVHASAEQAVTCPYCSKRYKNRNSLQVHIKHQHGQYT